MPKLSPAAMNDRRVAILEAARRVFARKGFHGTTIADLCREAGVSAGGLYTHFDSKHAVVAALGSDATEGGGARDLLGLYRQLQSDRGGQSAQLDVQLWAAAIGDEGMKQQVDEALEAFRGMLRAEGRSEASVVLLEALALGFEVQRALDRPTDPGVEARLSQLLDGEGR